MYNEERKIAFIEEYKHISVTSELNYKAKFTNIESYEESLGVDLCEFSIKEITSYYKSLSTFSLEVLVVTNSLFSIYTDWCIKNKFVKDNQNHYRELTVDVLLSCVNKTLINGKITSRDNLLKLCNNLPNEYEKFLLLALFEGFCGKSYEEIYNALPEQLKETENGYVWETSSGRTLSISDELYHAFMNSCEEYTYYCYNNNDARFDSLKFDPNSKGPFKTLERSSSTELTNVLMIQRMNLKIKRMRNNCDGAEFISAKGLAESGRIDMINRYAAQDSISGEEAIVKYRDEITTRYGKIQSIYRYLLKYGEYLC